jgi:hypothetical protein
MGSSRYECIVMSPVSILIFLAFLFNCCDLWCTNLELWSIYSHAFTIHMAPCTILFLVIRWCLVSLSLIALDTSSPLVAWHSFVLQFHWYGYWFAWGFFGLCSPISLQDFSVEHRNIYSHASAFSHGSVYDFVPCKIVPATLGPLSLIDYQYCIY